MEFLIPKYRYDPNEKVVSLYSGIAQGNRTVTTVVKPSLDRNHLEATRTYESAMPLQRGESGRAAVLVIGGLETTLDEMRFLLEEGQRKPYVVRRRPQEIAEMCRLVIEQRNDRIKYLRKNPSETRNLPKPKQHRVRLHLPVGFRYQKTSEPGLEILARV